jgi:hypothetical protein
MMGYWYQNAQTASSFELSGDTGDFQEGFAAGQDLIANKTEQRKSCPHVCGQMEQRKGGPHVCGLRELTLINFTELKGKSVRGGERDRNF